MQTPLNLELPDSGASSDKAYIRKLLAEVERELHAEQKYAARLTMKWLVAYDMVRTQEASLMVQDGPILAEQTALRGYLAILRGHGIHLLAWLEREGHDPQRLTGASLEDMSAILDELEIAERAWSEKHLPGARVAALEAVFGDGQAPE